MTRSSLTLAASVSAALPDASPTAAARLSTRESGRFDSAVVTLDDAARVVVRVSTDDAGAAELVSESLALEALTPGARAQLPFAVPGLRASMPLGPARALVVDWVPGYAVEAAQLPPGPGAAVSLGAALAALHALPPSVVRAAGLAVRSSEESRQAAAHVVDRAAATRRLPIALASRWRAAIDDDRLWSFEPTVVLAACDASSFRFEDVADVPTVTGVIGWHALAVGDPALDLHWLAGAPQAAADVHAAYAAAASRTPDPGLRVRAQLYAELEFARWLAHGHELHRDDIVEDAVALLDSLVDGLAQAEPLSAPPSGDAWAARAPESADDGLATAMQTDAYDPRELSAYAEAEGTTGLTQEIVGVELGADEAGGTDPDETLPVSRERRRHREPVDLAARARARQPAVDVDEVREAERASRAAFQRWTSSGSE